MTQLKARSTTRRRGSAPLLLVLLLLGGAGYLAWRMVLPPKPEIALGGPFKVVGRATPLSVRVTDAKSGVKSVRVLLRQGNAEVPLAEETYDPPRPEVKLDFTPGSGEKARLKEGDGTLIVEARNGSWGEMFKGKSARLEEPFKARLTPPRLEVLSRQHYVNQGGCDLVVYRVTPADASNGVTVGKYVFAGYPMPGSKDPTVHFSIFAIPYELPANTPVRLEAWDEAANKATATFWLKPFPKRFRSRPIELSDDFLNKVVPEIMGQTPALQDKGNLVENYLAINRDLRMKNNAELTRLAAASKREFLWSRPFQQLGNSQVEAQFADHRSYMYQGKEIDKQDHLGFDLATTANAPVTAANDGIVVKAEFFGIYGNTVVIDHGYGLLSLYGHLSSFAVKAGDRVTRGQTVGRSGATGLAGGDHLHFSTILGPAQVDAREWWDAHWIEDRIAAKLREFGGPGVGPAGPATPAGAVAPQAPAPGASTGGYVEEAR